MAKRRVVLTFPQEQVAKPVTYHLVKDFDLEPNILRAEIEPPEIGRMLVELKGEAGSIDEAVAWLESLDIGVEDAARDIHLKEEECVHCGACTAVCIPDALTLDPDSLELVFDKARCTFCRNCLPACPLALFEIEF